MTIGSPALNVLLGEAGVAKVGQFFCDVLVGDAVVEHLVDEFPDVRRQGGDFAGGAPLGKRMVGLHIAFRFWNEFKERRRLNPTRLPRLTRLPQLSKKVGGIGATAEEPLV